MAYQLKDPLWLRSLLWHGFSPWPRNFCMPWVWPKKPLVALSVPCSEEAMSQWWQRGCVLLLVAPHVTWPGPGSGVRRAGPSLLWPELVEGDLCLGLCTRCLCHKLLSGNPASSHFRFPGVRLLPALGPFVTLVSFLEYFQLGCFDL